MRAEQEYCHCQIRFLGTFRLPYEFTELTERDRDIGYVTAQQSHFHLSRGR